LLNYRARYYAQSLNVDEQSDWFESCRRRLTDEKNGFRTLEQQQKEINQLLNDTELSQQKRKILHALSDWNQEIAIKFSLNTALK
jgi:exodeoxyribonuclease-1